MKRYEEETNTLLRMFGKSIQRERENVGLTRKELADRMKKVDDETIREGRRAFGYNVREAREDAGLSIGD